MSGLAARTPAPSLAIVIASLLVACASPPPSPERYRLSAATDRWDVIGSDAVLEDLAPRYPEFYAALFESGKSVERPAHDLRQDLERSPVTRSNYDALNSIAIAYFEINHRAESQRHSEGLGYLSTSFESAKLLARLRRGGGARAPGRDSRLLRRCGVGAEAWLRRHRAPGRAHRVLSRTKGGRSHSGRADSRDHRALAQLARP